MRQNDTLFIFQLAGNGMCKRAFGLCIALDYANLAGEILKLNCKDSHN